MSRRTLWYALLGAALLGAALWLVGPRSDRRPAAAGPVVLKPANPVELRAGEAGEAIVEVVVARGFHVQANPAPLDYLIPTRLEVAAVVGFEAGRPVYPPGRPYRLAGSADTLSVYDGAFEIALPVRAAAGVRPGRYELRGEVHYQRCDDRMCFRPVSQPVVFTVRVRGEAEGGRP